MPTFEVRLEDGRTLDIDAPNAKAAAHGAGLWAKANPKPTGAQQIMRGVTGFMAQVNRGSGIGDELAAAAATAGNLMTGKTRWDKGNPAGMVRAVGADFGRNMAKQRALENDFQRTNPKSAALARGVGMTTAAAVPMGDAAIVAQSGRALNAARGATSAALTGAVYAAADEGTLKERALAAAKAADPLENPAAFVLGGVLGATMGGKAKAPAKEVPADVVKLREMDVPLTPGQAAGGLAKAMEDRATSVPILGDAIQEARRAGIEGFNVAAANDALSHIGAKVPKAVTAGHDLVGYVERTLGKAYDDIVPTGAVVADSEFKAGLAASLSEINQDLTPEASGRLANILDGRLFKRFTKTANGVEAMDGRTFQMVNSQLGTVAKRFLNNADSDKRAIGEALEVARQELQAAASRLNPDFAAKKAAIDAGWAKFKRLQGAAASAGAEAGVFTPAQYGASVRRMDGSLDKGASARGSALGKDLADVGKAVLPSKLPESGTSPRLMTGALVTAPATVGAGYLSGGLPTAMAVAGGQVAALGLLKAGSRAYTPSAIAAANRALDAKISAQAQAAALQELERLSGQSQALRQLYVDVAQRVSRPAAIMTTESRAPDSAR